jgi:hypothetical protein
VGPPAATWFYGSLRGHSTKLNVHMRTKILALLCGAALPLCYTANANTIEVSLDPSTHLPSDVSFQDVIGGGNPDTIIPVWLSGEILSYFNHLGIQLPDPTTGLVKFDNLNGTPPVGGVPVIAGDYVVVHYGAGNGGTAGGGLVAFYFDAAQTFNPSANGSGPNGLGGISFVDVFDHVGTVPDGGSTLLLCGATIAALGFFARLRQKKLA